MKSNLKLAIGIGIISSFIPLACASIIFIIAQNAPYKPSDTDSFLGLMLLDWICALIIPFGEYYYATGKSKIALASVILASIFILIVSGFFGLFLLIWAFPIGLMLITSVFLTFITIILTM